MNCVAKKHNGNYLGEIRVNGVLKHQFICCSNHTFSLTTNRINNGAWCPICGKEKLKLKLTQRNKQANKCPKTLEELKLILDKHSLRITEETVLPRTSQDFITVLSKDGQKFTKRFGDVIRFGAGKKKEFLNTKRFEFEQKIKRSCEEVGYQFVKIEPPTIKGTVTYLHNGIEYTKQAVYFKRNRHKADKRVSRTQKLILDYLASLGFTPTSNHRIFLTKEEENTYNWYYKHVETKTGTRSRYIELDIFLKEQNIAIEFHGARYHDAFRSKHHKYLPKFKYEYCREKNIRLIQINQWEWNDKAKSILRNLLGKNENKIYAKNCEVKEVSVKDVNRFYGMYHMKGERKNIKVSYGLFHKDTLVMVCSLSMIENKLHLSRLCSLPNTTVVGGVGKLTSFIKKHGVIHTMIDLMWYNGDSWIKVGWKLSGKQDISYVYVKENTNIPINKEHFRGLSDEIKLKYSEQQGCVEFNYAKDLGYHQLWDCGKLKLTLDN